MNARNDRLPDGWESWLEGLGSTPRARIKEWARRFGVSERTARRWADRHAPAAPVHVVEAIRREIDRTPLPADHAFEALSYVEQVVRVASDKDDDFRRRALRVIGAAVRAALLANNRRLHPALTRDERDALERSVKLLGFTGSDGLRTTETTVAPTVTVPYLGGQLKTAPVATRAKQNPESESET